MAKEKKYEKTFAAKINMQNPPKAKFVKWYVRKANKKSIPEYTVCGYEFTENIKYDTFGSVEGFSPKMNFRKAILPEEGHYHMSRDFSGQELRIMANLADEPAWINAFLTGADIHAETAFKVWGKENYTPEKRNIAKTLNFGLLYGTTAYPLSQQLGITEDEAQAYIDSFFKGLPNIKRFMNAQAVYVRNNKDLVNFYGRKRRFHNDFKAGVLQNSGIRQSYNFPIQSMGAEVTKLALIKLYDRLLNNPEYKDKIKFMSTIHDEINFSVQYDFIKEAAKITEELMTHVIPGKPVPIITGLEIGHSMGLMWEFEQDPETLELKPTYKPLTEKELEEKDNSLIGEEFDL